MRGEAALMLGLVLQRNYKVRHLKRLHGGGGVGGHRGGHGGRHFSGGGHACRCECRPEGIGGGGAVAEHVVGRKEPADIEEHEKRRRVAAQANDATHASTKSAGPWARKKVSRAGSWAD
jgi:hypothetical protein